MPVPVLTQTQQAAMSKEFYDTEKIPTLYHIQALQSRTVLQGGRQEGCWAWGGSTPL